MNKPLLLFVALTFFSSAACAQNYQNNARVINQSTNGLAAPSSSYIGSGTLSKSAQGVNQPPSNTNPNLPAVNMGANVRTPGDNQYRPKQQQSYSQQTIRTSGKRQPVLHYYEPGQNNQPRSYQPNQYSKVRGTATYAEQGYGN